MRLPTTLKDPDAIRFWKRHAAALASRGILTERDVETFCLLARIWALLERTDPDEDPKQAIRFVGLAKQYQSLARQFGLMPKDRRKDGNIGDDDEPKDDLLRL